ncbi:MAG: PEGA domain-containing protein [Bacteroidales bacterium]|nr:PEGA domain-containing protein [Bacteroidales bacterium]
MINANARTKLVSILIISGILASGCASSTVLQTNPSDASVYVKGEKMGTTPYTYKDRKIAGASTLLTFTKEGYEDYSTTLRRVERWNAGALIAGLFFIYPLFWVLSYDQEHTYDLFPAVEEQPSEQAIDVAEKEDIVEIEEMNDPVYEPDLVRADNNLKSERVEKFLTDGRINRAVEYAEKQEGEYRSACLFTLGEYYLNNDSLSLAEDYFNKSGKTKEGNVKIAESFLKGDLIDSIRFADTENEKNYLGKVYLKGEKGSFFFVIDNEKVKTYLEKVYDNEEDVLKHMAFTLEEYALESKKRLELTKSLKEMGLMSMSSDGKTVNINETYKASFTQTFFYFLSAADVYEKLGNTRKVEELRGEIDLLTNELL